MSQSAQFHLREAIAGLKAAGVPDAVGDARRLMAHALGCPMDRLTLHLQDPISQAAAADFERFVKARQTRQPVSHILGYRMFWGHRFKVTPDVLDPRPETECLIESALSEPFKRVLDLGTGSGCILLSLLAERSEATGLGVDASSAALEIAGENAASLCLGDRVAFVVSDWFAAVSGTFDLIVSNPPYISAGEMETLAPDVLRWEPPSALTPGYDGLEAYRAIADGIIPHLSAEGRVLLEIGPTQARAVIAIFEAAGLGRARTQKDLDGRDRVVELRRVP